MMKIEELPPHARTARRIRARRAARAQLEREDGQLTTAEIQRQVRVGHIPVYVNRNPIETWKNGRILAVEDHPKGPARLHRQNPGGSRLGRRIVPRIERLFAVAATRYVHEGRETQEFEILFGEIEAQNDAIDERNRTRKADPLTDPREPLIPLTTGSFDDLAKDWASFVNPWDYVSRFHETRWSR